MTRAFVRRVGFAAPLLALVGLGCKPTVNDIYAALPPIGSTVPNFHFASLNGAALSAESLRGKPAVVALWATTCSASRLALASLAALDSTYASRGARVIILADDHDSATVATVVVGGGVHVPTAIGAGSLMNTFTHGQSVLPWRKAFALPTFLVLDATGKVVYQQIGIERDSAQQLLRVRSRLDSLLANPQPVVTVTPAV